MHDSNLRESQILAWSIVNEPYEKRPLDLNKKKKQYYKEIIKHVLILGNGLNMPNGTQ